VRERLPKRWAHPVTVVTVPRADGSGVPAGDVDHRAALAAASPDCAPAPCRREDPAVLLFTSGSTGPPKAVAIATNFPAAIWPAIRHAGDLRAEDEFWPTGDPGWGYGLVCFAVALAAARRRICGRRTRHRRRPWISSRATASLASPPCRPRCAG
jgi:acetyl-CoA synthetase